MYNTIVTLLLTVACIVPAAAKTNDKTSDPVVMNIAGDDVRLSEFSYLYNKNSEQQAEPVSLDEYVQMFVNYKLKVRAAHDARIDTLPSYLAEFSQFRNELAAPYMRCKAVDDSLAALTYERMKRNVELSHIVIPASKRQLADSLRRELAAGADFAAVAAKYSDDKYASRTGGYMGFVLPGQLPVYALEDAAFSLPVGAVSEVIPSRWGLHILKVESERPNPGEVKVRHILKLTAGLTPEKAARKKVEIDSIYSLLLAGADFKEMASRETEDRSGSANGGDLPWFGPGQMVPRFEKAAFALADKQMSEPVATSYGYHIILREAHRPMLPYDSVSASLLDRITKDDRAQMAVERTLDRFMASEGVRQDAAVAEAVHAVIRNNGGINNTSRAAIAALGSDIIAIGDYKATCRQLEESLRLTEEPDPDKACAVADSQIRMLVYGAAREAFIAALPEKEPQYANLLSEYSDGLLLCEISNQKVWNRANTDSDGLQKCFSAHRDEFRWDRPHYKGYVIAARNDSLAEAAYAYLLSANAAPEDLGTTLRKQFGTDAKIEKVIAGKGDNEVIDSLAFGGDAPKISGRWTAYKLFDGKVIDQPEDAFDVKGLVSQKYQQQLEAEWLSELASRYPVKINRKMLASLAR